MIFPHLFHSTLLRRLTWFVSIVSFVDPYPDADNLGMIPAGKRFQMRGVENIT
jgi:hypothetical protein